MDATVTIEINPRDAIPVDQAARVAWLERYGLPSNKKMLEVTMPLADWLACGCKITCNGEVETPGTFSPPTAYHATTRLIRELVLVRILETGQVPTNLGAIIGHVLVARRAAVAKEIAERAELEAERRRLMAVPIEQLLDDQSLRSSPAYVSVFEARHGERRAHREQLEDLAKKKKLEEAAELKKTIRGWLVEHDRNNMRARFDAGVLGETELWKEITEHAFLRLAGFARFVPMVDADVDRCGDVSFFARAWGSDEDADPEDNMSAEEFAVLEQIAKAAPAGAKVDVRVHVGTCGCRAVADRYRYGARVTINWHGRELMREYSLNPKPATTSLQPVES